jgi:hypothetical protein
MEAIIVAWAKLLMLLGVGVGAFMKSWHGPCFSRETRSPHAKAPKSKCTRAAFVTDEEMCRSEGTSNNTGEIHRR